MENLVAVTRFPVAAPRSSSPERRPSPPEVHASAPALRIPSLVTASLVDEIPHSFSTSPPPSP